MMNDRYFRPVGKKQEAVHESPKELAFPVKPAQGTVADPVHSLIGPRRYCRPRPSCAISSVSSNQKSSTPQMNVFRTSLSIAPVVMTSPPPPPPPPLMCPLCREEFVREDGFCCPTDHFICWDCLSGYVKNALSQGAIKGFCDATGNLLCPVTSCKCPYNIRKAAGTEGAPEAIFMGLFRLKTRAETQRELEEALAAQAAMLLADHNRRQQLAGDERTAYDLQRKIIDDILTLKCPRCHAAFYDFKGCFALTCAVNKCAAKFCGWCLKDCGEDAHEHVFDCPDSLEPGDLFSTQELFFQRHKDRKKQLITELLAKENENVQRIVKEIMHIHLQEVGVEL